MPGSNSSSDPPEGSSKSQSKRPSSSAFKQQKLKAWQPVMTANTVIPAFFVLGVAFIPIGAGLWITSNTVLEHELDYTDCKNVAGDKCEELLASNFSQHPCTCSVSFTLDALYQPPVFLYYGLDNFYQNHRRYVKSRDDNQLGGKDINSGSDLLADCQPYRDESDIGANTSRYYAPCGAIANSMFNDTLSLTYNDSGSLIPVNVTKKGIAWTTDLEVKFRNPANNFSGSVKPPNWQKTILELDPAGYQNEDFIVWMRTAALPNFRKLYRKVLHDSNPVFQDGLPQGEYILTVTYAYPVSSFNGKKRMILTTTSWIGGKNPFLGIAYVAVGCVCIVLGFIFLVIHLKFSKKLADLTEITDQTPYSSAH